MAAEEEEEEVDGREEEEEEATEPVEDAETERCGITTRREGSVEPEEEEGADGAGPVPLEVRDGERAARREEEGDWPGREVPCSRKPPLGAAAGAAEAEAASTTPGGTVAIAFFHSSVPMAGRAGREEPVTPRKARSEGGASGREEGEEAAGPAAAGGPGLV